MDCPECGEKMFKSPDKTAWLCPNCEKKFAVDSHVSYVDLTHSLILILKIILIVLIIICAIVILVDCTKPISYGVAYYNQSKEDNGYFIFSRNNTFKYISYSDDGKRIKKTGTYSISQYGKSKSIVLNGSSAYDIPSRTSITNYYSKYKSVASDGIITCSILLVFSVIALIYIFVKYRNAY